MSSSETYDRHHLFKVEHEGTQKKDVKTSKKMTITVDEDDPCLKGREPKEDAKDEPKDVDVKDRKLHKSFGIGNDPRFQQQNQTVRCYVMYTDFYRCEHILGQRAEACSWFKDVFTAICPTAWVEKWDELRADGRLPWHRYKTQGNFPGSTYGD